MHARLVSCHGALASAVLLGLFCPSQSVAQSPASPKATVKKEAAAAKSASAKTAARPAAELPFEVVSVKRIDQADGIAGARSYWKKDAKSNGLVVILKRRSPEKAVRIYSTDFALRFGDEDDVNEIPCRPTIGISDGMKTPDADPSWNLGGAYSRTHADENEPYIAILFEAPKALREFSLRYSAPLVSGVRIPPQ